MKVIPLGLKEANQFVMVNHRHHKAVRGHKFSIGLKKDNTLIGVAICGRPVARHLDNGMTIEVSRLCTLGDYNACSKLYSACAKISKEMGYDKIITYILKSEKGTSLKASGWICDKESAGSKFWNSSGKNKRTHTIENLFGIESKYPQELKQMYSKSLIKKAVKDV